MVSVLIKKYSINLISITGVNFAKRLSRMNKKWSAIPLRKDFLF